MSQLPVTAEALERRARALLPVVRHQARRPYIVEFAGTPKAGKSTALDVLRGFFKQCGYHVEVMRERAENCPIAMKGHFFFNTWTTTTMIASMLENVDTEADIVLLDRGVFDSMVWLEDQRRAHQVSEQESEIFRNFALLERWRSLTDLTFVLTVAPERAMHRENAGRLVPRTGSIVSAPFLARYNAVLADVRRDLADRFHFVDIDTTAHESPRQTNLELASRMLDDMRRWVDPRIAAIPREVAEALFGGRPILELRPAMDEVERHVVYRRRSVLEPDEGYVQLVAAAVLRHDDQMLLLRRSSENDEKRVTFGRDVLWKGCHIDEPEAPSTSLLSTAATAIAARLKEDFHLAALGSEPEPRVLVWSEDPHEVRHLGIGFDLEIPSAEFARSLAGKVFKRERTGTKLRFHELVSPDALLARMSDPHDLQLESWSQSILRHQTRRDRAQEPR